MVEGFQTGLLSSALNTSVDGFASTNSVENATQGKHSCIVIQK